MIDKITRFVRWIWPYQTEIRKAIAAGAASVPISMGLVQVNGIEWWEWLYVGVAAIFAGLLTWVVPNDQAPAQVLAAPEPPSTSGTYTPPSPP